MNPTEPTKRCPTCPEGKSLKPISEFSRDATRHDGLQRSCKACWSRMTKARYTPHPRKVYLVIDGKKECSKCHVSKPVADFSKDRNKHTGLQSWCKVCDAQYAAEWLARPGNLERRKRTIAEWHAQQASHPSASTVEGKP